MLCPKCRGIQEVIKVHEEKDLSKPRLCDVKCLECGHVVYYQAYDFGSLINISSSKKIKMENKKPRSK